MVVWSASRPRSISNSSTSRSESEYRRYQRTAQRISSGAVCRHLKIAGRVACFTVFSGYQSSPPKLQHIRSRHKLRSPTAKSERRAGSFSKQGRVPYRFVNGTSHPDGFAGISMHWGSDWYQHEKAIGLSGKEVIAGF